MVIYFRREQTELDGFIKAALVDPDSSFTTSVSHKSFKTPDLSHMNRLSLTRSITYRKLAQDRRNQSIKKYEEEQAKLTHQLKNKALRSILERIELIRTDRGKFIEEKLKRNK